MNRSLLTCAALIFSCGVALHPNAALAADHGNEPGELSRLFQTSDRCFACHNGLTTPDGQDVSISSDWRSSVMANSSRDPYWQASVRREIIDHAPARSQIEDECSICHAPMTRYAAQSRGRLGQIFVHLPFNARKSGESYTVDGVSCSVCHQITPAKLGTPASYNGGFEIGEPTESGVHPEFGPFAVTGGRMRIMRSSSGGFEPNAGDQIQSAELCATCHTLITKAREADGRVIGELPEQMPYQEWRHSDYVSQRTCQSCHMPEVSGEAGISRVLPVPRRGMRRHEFIAANFFLQQLLGRHATELAVTAPPQELTQAADRTIEYLRSQAGKVSIDSLVVNSAHLAVTVTVVNLGGHKLPTAFPSRRAWLHFVVRDHDGRTVFESGALNPDGSIQGNDNDIDPARFEPHYREISRPDQVQIYEDILGDANGHVTTGLLSAVRYLKDNRLLPAGFDKMSAAPEIAVLGEASADAGFRGGQHQIRYSVDLAGSPGPYRVEVQLLYQPVGYRWANNLKPYRTAPEPARFTEYYDSAGAQSAVVLTSASRIGTCCGD
jgi:hypothetical protein